MIRINYPLPLISPLTEFLSRVYICDHLTMNATVNEGKFDVKFCLDFNDITAGHHIDIQH